jgi:hypothetical protein
VCHPFTTSEIECDSELAENTLFELGIPEYDILKVSDGQETLFIKLQNDSPQFSGHATASENKHSDRVQSTAAEFQPNQR